MDLKKFITNIFLFSIISIIAIIIAIILNAIIVKNQYLANYNASILDKVERLKAINEPKIILVGNSNLAFGMNSEKLEKEIGMPVVNLGIHGGLGNAFYENISKLNINESDIVIVCYSNYEADQIDYSLYWITIEKHIDLYKTIPKEDYLPLINAYKTYLKKSTELWIEGKGNKANEKDCYRREAFNKYGDVTFKPDYLKLKTEKLFYKNAINVPKIEDECINRLNKYNEYVKSKGATLLVAGYPIAYGEYTPEKEEYEKFENELREKLDCEVISNFTDYFIPYKYFFNTKLHLTKEGADIRTDLLINDIKNWQNKEET